MIVEQKTYAQILIIVPTDFIFSGLYRQYAEVCPFLCMPSICAPDFRASLKKPEMLVDDKDIILLLDSYWQQLSSEEKKAVLDHELGHIANGDLERLAEKAKKGQVGSNAPDFTEESKADAYSSEMNGKKAMRGGLLKAMQTMVDGARARGLQYTLDQWIASDPVIKKRLAVLAAE